MEKQGLSWLARSSPYFFEACLCGTKSRRLRPNFNCRHRGLRCSGTENPVKDCFRPIPDLHRCSNRSSLHLTMPSLPRRARRKAFLQRRYRLTTVAHQSADPDAFENTSTANRTSINPPSPAANRGGTAVKKATHPAAIRLMPITQKIDLPYMLAKIR